MFPCIMAIPLMQAVVCSLEEHKKQEKAFNDAVSKYAPEIAAKMVVEREEIKARMRKEATEERRHQELCRAISNSGKWF